MVYESVEESTCDREICAVLRGSMFGAGRCDRALAFRQRALARTPVRSAPYAYLPTNLVTKTTAGDPVCSGVAGRLRCFAAIMLFACFAANAQVTPAPAGMPVQQAPPAAPLSERAQAVFATARPRLLQLRVVLGAAQSQASLGSGFIVGADGWVITNYHVVSRAVFEPGQYSIEFVRADGTRGPLQLMAIDVVNDLAVLKLPAGPVESFFELRGPDSASGPVTKGERVFAMGNPHDLGLTIVEGTFNGLAETSFLERFHYTGAINAGMSGGPAVATDGRVIGVNVARLVSSQLVSFLVPAEHAIRLLAKARGPGAPARETLRGEVEQQLQMHEAALMTRVLARPVPTSRFDRYDVPDSLGTYMRCWGNSTRDRDRDRPFVVDAKTCTMDADVFVSDQLRTGDVQFRHLVISSSQLGRLRFQRLFADRFGADGAFSSGTKREHTKFRCDEAFVDREGGVVRAVICSRAYKRFAGLYDIRLKVATLDHDTRGLISSLEMDGVGFDDGMRFARAYLDAVRWAK